MDISDMHENSKLRAIWDTMDRQMGSGLGMNESFNLAPKNKKQGVVWDDEEIMVQQQMRHVHTMRTAAELRLNSSLLEERKSFSLIKPPPERDLLSEVALTTAHFGDGRAYVKTLPSKFVRDWYDKRRGPLVKIRGMKGLREERHVAALDAYQQERREVSHFMTDAVAQETAAFKQRMATNDADIQEEFAKLNDDKLLHLEEVAVKRVWDEVSAQFPVRTSWIESLSQMLYAIENDRQHVMRDTLAQVVAILIENAHIAAGVMDRIVEKEAVLVNHEINDNKRSYAELIRRLARKEVELDRDSRVRWEAAMMRWRKLRTMGAIKEFQDLMASIEYAHPPPRAKLLADLLTEQDSNHQYLENHVDSIKDMVPNTQLLTVPLVNNWHATVESQANNWDQVYGGYEAAFWAQEQQLHVRAMERYSGLVADVQRYNGFPPEEQARMLHDDALVLTDQRQKKAAATLIAMDRAVRAQTLQWRSQWGAISVWLRSVADMHDKHKMKCKALHRASENAVSNDRTQHEAEDADREGAFDAACNVLRQSANDNELEVNCGKVLDRLEDVKEGYRVFHKRQVHIFEQNPPTMDENGNDYQRRLCAVFCLSPNCPVPLPPPEPEPEPEPIVEEKKGDKGGKKSPPPESPKPKAKGGDKGKKGDKDKKAAVPEPEPEPEPVVDLPPPLDPEYIHTDLGVPFVVTSDLYSDVFPPAPPLPTAEEEAAAAEAAAEEAGAKLRPTTANSAAGKKAPAGKKPSTPKGKPGEKTEEELEEEACQAEAATLQAALDERTRLEVEALTALQAMGVLECNVTEGVIRSVLKVVQVGMLSEMSVHQEKVMKFAATWMVEHIEDVTAELDESLRVFRPRAGRVEEDLMRAREVELMEQTRRADAFIKSNIRLVQRQQAGQAELIGGCSSELEVLLGKMSNHTDMLVSTSRVKDLMIKHREMDKLKGKVEEKVVKQCDALRVQLKDDEAELLKANKKFTELFREFDAGGTYAKEKVDEVRKRLDFVIEQSGLARRDVGEDIDDLQEATLQDSSGRYDNFVSQLDPHREDLTLIEAIESVKAAAKSKHTAMFDDSNLISSQIKENSATLMQLVGKGIKQRGTTKKGLCVNVLGVVNDLRKLLLPRCKYLGCLKADMTTPPLVISLDPPEVELTDVAKAEKEKTEKDKAGKGKPKAATPRGAAGEAPKAFGGPPGEGDAEVPNLLEATEVLLTEAREKIKELAQQYYIETNKEGSDDHRPITRPERIPPSAEDMQAKHEITFADMQTQSESHVESGTKEVRAQVIATADWLIRVPGVTLGNMCEETMAAALKEADVIDKKFGIRHFKSMDVQEETKLALKPSLRPNEVDALEHKELERAHASVDHLRDHANLVMTLFERHAVEFYGRLSRATLLTMQLMDTTVLPEDLASLELDEHLRGMRRKNMRMLKRIHRGAVPHPEHAGEFPTQAMEGRAYMQRTWKNVDRQRLTLKAAGWETEHFQKAEGIAPPPAEVVAEEVLEREQIAALDTPSQQAAVNARDRVFNEFVAFYYKQVEEHKQMVLTRLKGETQWKTIWDTLVNNCKGSLGA